ncbi:MAG: von Willebrand factor type A domain-containing protein [Chloroflexota bacterium]
MNTKRNALTAGILLLLLVTSACGGAAATQAPAATSAPNDNYVPAATEAPAIEAPANSPESIAPSYSPTNAAPNSNTSPNQSNSQPGQQPPDMFFQNYGVNPLIDTEDDHLTTFGLDVDTGSYTVMRNYLNDGNLPPSDSVRVEEYINYFKQNYPNPSAHQTFGITMDGAPAPFTQTERYQMLRIGIQGYQVPEEDRKPVSLIFVIDVSGSMNMENRLELVKRSLELLVEQLGRRDSVGIVAFGSDARVVLDPTAGSDKDAILSAIYSLHTDGATNAEAGIRLGYKLASHSFNSEGVNRVILCSDGVANIGDTDAQVVLDEIHGHAKEQIMMTTIGFGMGNYNDTLMEQLADNGNGFYAYVDDMREAKKLFVDNLTGTLQTIAKDAKVQVDFNPDVVMRYRLVGFENRAIADNQFRDNSVDAGEIGAGHSVTALYEVKLYPEAYGKIATVYMRWEDPDSHSLTEISKDFSTNDLAREFRDADVYFQRAVVVAEYAQVLKKSYWAQDYSLNDVYREANRIYESMPRERDMDEFMDLLGQALRYSE